MKYRYLTLQTYGNARLGYNVKAARKSAESRGEAVAWVISKIGHFLHALVQKRNLNKALEKMERREIPEKMPKEGGVLVEVLWLTNMFVPYETSFKHANVVESGKDFESTYKKFRKSSRWVGIYPHYQKKYTYIWVTRGGKKEKK